jgi:peptide/nickel transport system permease protein
MARFIARRLIRSLVALVVFQTILFALVQAVPGDYVSTVRAPTVYKNYLRATLGLDQPVWRQYLHWSSRFFTGDLGFSFQARNVPVTRLLLALSPRTLLLFLPAALLGFALGIWLGKRIAWRRGGWLEFVATLGGVASYTSFAPWLAFVLIYFFAFGLGWLPAENLVNANLWRGAPVRLETVIGWLLASGVAAGALWAGLWQLTRRASARRPLRLLGSLGVVALAGAGWAATGWGRLALDVLRHLVLPLATLALLSFGETMLLMRASMLEHLRADHVLTARAKGLPDAEVRDRHVARPALLPVIARLVLQLPFVLVGSFVIERAYFWGGMGEALFTAADYQDLPVLLGVLSVVGVLMLLAHVALDILNAWLDPRVRDATIRPLSG